MLGLPTDWFGQILDTASVGSLCAIAAAREAHPEARTFLDLATNTFRALDLNQRRGGDTLDVLNHPLLEDRCSDGSRMHGPARSLNERHRLVPTVVIGRFVI